MKQALLVGALCALSSAEFLTPSQDSQDSQLDDIYGASWNKSAAETSFQLSNLAYCGHTKYSHLDFNDKVKGFVVTHSIYNASKDTEGFIGYLPSDKAIYVSFRGSSSIPNWITNLKANLVHYDEFSDCRCKVHAGFQDAVDAVKKEVLREVQHLHKQYPSYQIKVTGHSLGGALAQLTGMMLIHNGYDVEMINFGQPRIGDQAYAEFANKKFRKSWRQVHYRDIVPHSPGQEFHYQHSRYEVYEDEHGHYKTCNSSCEDPSCSDQWKSYQWSVNDHLTYMGHPLPDGKCKTKRASFEESPQYLQ